ncbi:MAG: hypothetical protein AMK69_18235 [Nitrospira bacterium SG8_3]|nr:MAG: hypothetical protein AMK69_18235 [Nitrospira bacterium SG8_3]
MEVIYRKVLEHIQTVFPQPVSNRVHDSSFREILFKIMSTTGTFLILCPRKAWPVEGGVVMGLGD